MNESVFKAVTNIAIGVAVAGRSSAISKVEFFAGDTKIGEDTTSPYSIIWSNVYAGYYELKAIATDSSSNKGTSSPVYLNVQGTAADGRCVA